MSRRVYSDIERAKALALFDMCGSLTETANKTGIPDSTLSQWIRGQSLNKNPHLPKLRNDIGQSLANNFDEIAFEVASVALRKLRSKGADKIPFGQLMQGGGVAVDKSQLLKGLPTSITETVERQDMTIILQSALSDAIDITPLDTDS